MPSVKRKSRTTVGKKTRAESVSVSKGNCHDKQDTEKSEGSDFSLSSTLTVDCQEKVVCPDIQLESLSQGTEKTVSQDDRQSCQEEVVGEQKFAEKASHVVVSNSRESTTRLSGQSEEQSDSDTGQSQEPEDNVSWPCPRKECQDLKHLLDVKLEKMYVLIECQEEKIRSLERERVERQLGENVLGKERCQVSSSCQTRPFMEEKELKKHVQKHFSKFCLRCGDRGHKGKKCPTYSTEVLHLCEKCLTGFHFKCLTEQNGKQENKQMTQSSSCYGNRFPSRQPSPLPSRDSPDFESSPEETYNLSSPVPKMVQDPKATQEKHNTVLTNPVDDPVDSKAEMNSISSKGRIDQDSAIRRQYELESDEKEFQRMCKLNRHLEPSKLMRVMLQSALRYYYLDHVEEADKFMEETHEQWLKERNELFGKQGKGKCSQKGKIEVFQDETPFKPSAMAIFWIIILFCLMVPILSAFSDLVKSAVSSVSSVYIEYYKKLGMELENSMVQVQHGFEYLKNWWSNVTNP